MHDHILSCTFCKKSEQQVRKLVAGPGVYICDRCTERAYSIIQEGVPPSSPGSLWQRATGQLHRFFAGQTNKRELHRASEHTV